MGWSNLTPDERTDLLSKMNKGQLTHEDASRIQMNYESLKRRLREHRAVTPEDAGTLFESILDRKQNVVPIEDQTVVVANNVIITSDWHWPYTDMAMIIRVLALGMKHNIRRLIIVGDTSNFDEYSHFAVKKHDPAPPLNKQLADLFAVLRLIGNWFTDGIEISAGNHDERMQYANGGHMSLGDLFDFAKTGIRYTQHRVIWLKTDRALYALIHPEAYRALSNGLAQDYATVLVPPAPYQDSKFGVMVAHTHIGTTGFTKDGLHEVVGLSAMLDSKFVAYKQRGASKLNAWNKGFVMVKNTYVYPMYENHTDWSFFLGEYYHLIYKALTK